MQYLYTNNALHAQNIQNRAAVVEAFLLLLFIFFFFNFGYCDFAAMIFCIFLSKI